MPDAIRRRRRVRGWPIALLFLLIVVAAGALFEADRRHELYWYDVSADYRYDFRGEEVERVPVRIGREGFSLPDRPLEGRTALLRLTLEPRVTSFWFEPWVEVASPRGTRRHYFERRGFGIRYLNLGRQGLESAGGFVALDGSHLRWREQEGELLLFSAPDPEHARILVLAPHADDAEIAAFGLYAGRESWIVTITAGSYGGDVYARLVDAPDAREELQAALRVFDSLVVPRWAGLGPDRALNLGYFTSTLEPMYRDRQRVVPSPFNGSTDIARWRAWNVSPLLEGRPSLSTWENLVGDLALLLERVRPEIVVSPHPALDGSADHAFTTVALLEALERLGDPPTALFLYTNHHPLSHYVPFGPADAHVTIPPWLDAATPFRAVHDETLDAERQVAKLFALNAMHDLRPAPYPALGGPAERTLQRIREATAELRRDPALELSYFRRAARPNELFFVYRVEDREALRLSLVLAEDS